MEPSPGEDPSENRVQPPPKDNTIPQPPSRRPDVQTTVEHEVEQPDPTLPDWKQRYEDLHAVYLDRFTPPRIGQPVRILLTSGRQQQGILAGITETDLELNISNGTISYPKESLQTRSVKDFYAQDFAEYHALQQTTVEYNTWLRKHRPVERPQVASTTPQTSYPPQRRGTPEPEEDSEERIPMFPIPPELLGR